MNWKQIYKEYGDKHSIDGPHGWIQWKGTDVCIDVHCACGHLGHFDGEFAYLIRCPACQQVYYVSQYVHLEKVEVDESEIDMVRKASLWKIDR